MSVRFCGGWLDQLQGEFAGTLQRHADTLTRLESGFMQPITAEANLWFDALPPEVAGGFDLEGAFLAHCF